MLWSWSCTWEPQKIPAWCQWSLFSLYLSDTTTCLVIPLYNLHELNWLVRITANLIVSQSFTTLQSWWTWDNVERADLWHKCIYDNNTATLMCASATENGTYCTLIHSEMNENFSYCLLVGRWQRARVSRLSQIGCSRCRHSWSCPWSSPLSPSSCSFASSSPHQRGDSSTSAGFLRSLQVKKYIYRFKNRPYITNIKKTNHMWRIPNWTSTKMALLG